MTVWPPLRGSRGMLLLLFVTLAIEPAWALGGEPRVRILRPESAPDRISELRWDSAESLPVVSGRAILIGHYSRKDWHLRWKKNGITLLSTSGLMLQIPIANFPLVLTIAAIGPKGESESETFQIVALKEIVRKPPPPVEESPFRFLTGLGTTFVSYDQTAIPRFSETALTGKFSASYHLPSPCWEAEAITYLTLLPIATQPSDTSMTFFGLNLRLGYALLPSSSSWKVSVYAGGFYTTTWVTRGAFGYQNLRGPEVYPTIQLSLDHRNAISAYGKLAPLTNGITLLNLNSREFAVGSAYIHDLPDSHSVSITLDYSQVHLEFKNAIIDSSTLSLGIAYGF